MFKVVDKRKIWWPVTVRLAEDDGKVEEHVFSMHFVIGDVDENR